MEQTIRVGCTKSIHFPAGYYAYVGSALGGLKSRLNHHLKTGKKLHWHIDYLLDKARISRFIIAETQQRIECSIARQFLKQLDCIPGFGSSDCQCRSHLFFAAGEEELITAAGVTLSSLGIKPETIDVAELMK